MTADVLKSLPQAAQDAGAKAEPDDWKRYLRYNAEGNLTKDVGNAVLILKNAPEFQGALWFDTMACRVNWAAAPKYEVGFKKPRPGSLLADHHAGYVQQVLAKYWRLSVSKDVAWAAIDIAAHEHEIHPVKDYLVSLPPWDGVKRFPTWLHRYAGAADTDYNAAVGRWWLISAVARAYQPGCQVDHMLILEGGQGLGKSQAVRVLGGKWTLGSLPDVRDAPRAADAIGTKWIIEIGELDALKGANMTRIKDFVSQQIDSYRPAYGRATIDRPRSCVFIGTTNETNYLNDPTGARRFWPVRVERDVQLEALRADRDQLWAEARLAYEAGEQWHPEKPLLPTIAAEQEERHLEHPWLAGIRKYVHGVAEVTTTEILLHCIKKELSDLGRADQMAVSQCMHKIGGFTDKRRDTPDGGKERVWLRVPQE